MIRDYQFFLRRYTQLESDFLDITDFIELKEDFLHPAYRVGSSKLMDFCIKVGTEVETLFREILNNNILDSSFDITSKRKHQNIDAYRTAIEPVYMLSEYRLFVLGIEKEIIPFEGFDSNAPEWFSIYSKYKHDKLTLINEWNLKHSLYALACLLLLVINHPSLATRTFRAHNVSRRVFELLNTQPRFCHSITTVSF